MKKILPFLMIIIFLVGCSGGAQAPNTSSNLPESTPTGSAFLQTLPTFTSAPTDALSPTSTPASTLITTSTSSPTTTAVPDENQFAFDQNKRLGRGVNFGNALEAPNEGDWGVTLDESYFKTIEDGGFNSVRIPIRWTAHMAEKAPYTIDPVFLARIDWAIDQALKHHLAAVINIHAFDAIMEQPTENKERFLAIWSQLAEHYKGYPDGLYFEPLNEPASTLANTVWLQYAAEAIQEIRLTNPKRTIIVGPGNWNNVNNIEEMGALPKDDRNLIVTFHYYLPFKFTHQGAEWVNGSSEWLGTTWTGSADEKNAVLNDFKLAADWSQKYKRPVYVGEFGAYSKADDASRHLWTDFVARTAEANGFSWAYWEFGSGFGVYDRDKKSWNEPIYTALIPK